MEIIFDSGASGHVLNDRSLFDSDLCTSRGPLLHGITESVRIEGKGTFTCKAIGRNGKVVYLLWACLLCITMCSKSYTQGE